MLNSSENEETISNNGSEESNRPACAACKHQRKKCRKGCPFLLHFPATKHQEFSAVHQIFGIANMSKMMRDIDLSKQSEVVESIIWEAMVWTNKDHKEHGPYGLYKKLKDENTQLKEQLRKFQQSRPKSPVAVSRCSWQGGNSTTNVKASRTQNYSGHTQENESLLLNSTVNSCGSLRKGCDRETQGISTTPPELGFQDTSNITPPGLGYEGLPQHPSFLVLPERDHEMREGLQEKSHLFSIPQSMRHLDPAQVLRRNHLVDISNYPGSPVAASSTETRRLNRYHPYSLPQYPDSSLHIPPQRTGLISQQYPFVNSSMQNNPHKED